MHYQPNHELMELEDVVANQSPVTTEEVRQIVSRYFVTIKWSLLKKEWENEMNTLEREKLYTKLLIASVNSNTNKLKALKLNDLDDRPELYS
jgi:hypothetical protein